MVFEEGFDTWMCHIWKIKNYSGFLNKIHLFCIDKVFLDQLNRSCQSINVIVSLKVLPIKMIQSIIVVDLCCFVFYLISLDFCNEYISYFESVASLRERGGSSGLEGWHTNPSKEDFGIMISVKCIILD